MPFDNTPSEGSGGGSGNEFWASITYTAQVVYYRCLPAILGSLYTHPTAGCLGMWTADSEPHYFLWRSGSFTTDKKYFDLVSSVIKTTGPCPTSEQSAGAMKLFENENGGIFSTRVYDTPLTMALVTNEESGALLVAGVLSMCHIFGDPLQAFEEVCKSNHYWHTMFSYFSVVDARIIASKW